MRLSNVDLPEPEGPEFAARNREFNFRQRGDNGLADGVTPGQAAGLDQRIFQRI
jgi:hypothetical protein